MTTPSRRPNSLPRPWEAESGGEAVSFGAWLRRQREMREVGLREIADSTKISIRFLEAFEQDRFEILPAPVFARGFLREYAKYVGLNPDEVVNYYLTSTGAGGERGRDAMAAAEAAANTAVSSPAPGGSARGMAVRPPARDWHYIGMLALGTLALVGVAAWLASIAQSRQRAVATQPSPIAPPAVILAVPSEAPAPTAPLRLQLEFQEDCWVERVIDGAPRLSELRVRGETLQIEAQSEVVLTLGNPRSVRLAVNGVAYNLPSDPQAVVRDLKIDLATVAGAGVSSLGATVPPVSSPGP